MRPKVLLFVSAMILGGLGGMLGSMLGNAFGKNGLFVGGVIGGLVAAILTGRIAAARKWVPSSGWRHVAIGAALGFLAAVAIAVNTLSSPIGPVLSTILVGVGALIGARLAAAEKNGGSPHAL